MFREGAIADSVDSELFRGGIRKRDLALILAASWLAGRRGGFAETLEQVRGRRRERRRKFFANFVFGTSFQSDYRVFRFRFSRCETPAVLRSSSHPSDL